MTTKQLEELKEEIEALTDETFNMTTVKMFMSQIVRAILELDEYKKTDQKDNK